MSLEKNTPQPINPSESEEKETISKAYRSPQLIEYGSIQQLTNAVGNMGMMDGGMVMGANKS